MYHSSKRHGVNINIFWDEKFVFEKKQTNAKFDLFKNFFSNTGLCAFYIEYKKSKIHGS